MKPITIRGGPSHIHATVWTHMLNPLPLHKAIITCTSPRPEIVAIGKNSARHALPTSGLCGQPRGLLLPSFPGSERPLSSPPCTCFPAFLGAGRCAKMNQSNLLDLPAPRNKRAITVSYRYLLFAAHFVRTASLESQDQASGSTHLSLRQSFQASPIVSHGNSISSLTEG